jgi:hypothetical protein
LYTVIDTISYPVQQIPFPAITVCPPGVDRWAFIEKVMNYIIFQCYKGYGYSDRDCLESKQARNDFSFLLERIHQMALDATMTKINLMNETDLEDLLYRYIGRDSKNLTSKKANDRGFVATTEKFFRQLLHYASLNNSMCASVETIERKLSKFILVSIGRISKSGNNYLTELEASINDEQCNKSMPDEINVPELMECLNRSSCSHWIKLGMSYIDMHAIYGKHLVWDLGTLIAYFTPILSNSPWRLSTDEAQLHNHFKDIFRSLTSSNSTLSAYDVIALLGFNEQ